MGHELWNKSNMYRVNMIHESIRSKIQYMININIVFKIEYYIYIYIYKSTFSIIINLGSIKWIST